MKVKGEIYTEVNIESFDMIKALCQSINVVNERGEICAKVEDDVIIRYYFDDDDQEQSYVLYSQPFDVEYAALLINLYRKTQQLLGLDKEEILRSSDYKTARQLKLK